MAAIGGQNEKSEKLIEQKKHHVIDFVSFIDRINFEADKGCTQESGEFIER